MKKIPFASGFVLTLFATIGGAEGNETAKVLTLDEVLVTGTHIRGVESASPVVIYDAQHIEQSGYSSVQQFLASIPQNWTGAASDQGASAQVATTDHSFPGESSPNIHGLGSGATLTLVNGQRLAAAGYGINADLSMVPLSAIERIELVTDGASALYGSDAIAGVVNIVLKESLAGAETVAEYGGATSGGHTRMRVAQSLGRDWSGGHGLISYEYSGQSALEAEDREFSPPSIVGAYLAPEMKRHSGFATVRQDVGAHTELFGSVLYAHKRTDSLNVLRSASSNTADQYAATGGVRRNLAKTWTLSISGSLGDSQMSELSRFGAAISGDAVVDAGHWSASALLQGELLPLPGGAIKLAAGSEYREERLRKFNRAAGVRSMDERRTVEAGFAELNIPLFGGENRRQLLHELTFSAAARFERYSDFGDTSNEKLGIRWRATPSVLLRGTTGTAFNAPSLLTMATPTQAVVFPLQDPLATPGPTTPSLLLLGAERGLDAETGRSTTVGLDIRPAGVPSLQLSLTYFETRYSGRIQAPAPTFIGMLINEHDYADFITRDPSLDVVNALIAGSDSFLNPFSIPIDAVEAIVNDRVQNVAAIEVRGWDFSLDYRRNTRHGVFAIGMAAEKLDAFEQRLTRTSERQDVSNTVFNPPAWKLRTDFSWTLHNFSVSSALNYVDSYVNTLIAPFESVPSFATIDLRCSYEFDASSRILGGLTLALSAINVLDEAPPRVRGALAGYDATNASPFERLVLAQVRKRW